MSDKRNIDLKQIGQRIRAARIERGMSQEDLAFESSVAVANISDIELGKKDFRISTFIRIIEVLKISADEILRADVPSVNALYQKDLSYLFADCKPEEMENIIQLITNIKKTWRTNN
ncbi:MAG: helix-turn-helix transcriptional regulator [Clostridiales bacterium]|nr:helix-turn-helix transcriptional regulator [Clostridiales bacterium]